MKRCAISCASVAPENHDNYGAALIALRKDGQVGAAGTNPAFTAPDRLWHWAVASDPERDSP